LELPRRGEVRVAGRRVAPCAPATAVRAGIVAVPERRQLFPRLTVEDHLVLGLYALRPRLVRTARRTVAGSDVYDLFPVLWAESLTRLRAAQRAVLLVDVQRSSATVFADRMLTLQEGRLSTDGGQ
jgi:ABC-type branched-subunit amino acid transport system ATPase component